MDSTTLPRPLPVSHLERTAELRETILCNTMNGSSTNSIPTELHYDGRVLSYTEVIGNIPEMIGAD
jgi:hypothetical protein